MDRLPPAHDRHDLLLIAAYASDDAVGPDRDRAEALAASCPDCALLLGDLRAIGAATAALPAVERTRDFRLTPTDAARLRPSGWRRALGWLRGGPAGAGRGGAMRPLAIGLTTLGIVGLVFSATPLAGFGGSSASAPQALDESGGRNSSVTGAVNDSGASAGPAVQVPVAAGGGAAPSPASSAAAAASAAPGVASAAPPPLGPVTAATAPPAGGGGGSGKGASAPSAAPSSALPPEFAAGHVPSPAPTAAAPGLAGSPGAPSSAGSAPVLAIASFGSLIVGLALFVIARRRRRTVDPD